ncbi:alpha-xenorhabdolysin family binary toxin subunit A [Pseudomonas salmasensis]|uniref:alpha-xenorhabdolysin family binary toxin subunit A n=1 Tax=Pseudomonas salmasensis TaxID=2745514 RepID=UPI0016442005|nr:alpha-xenorhabdolysin family binary toxin subunit A [Pseudomonas salmasensis]QXH76735.1 alpha-xenorhabdolysin family binary toxin subunit A [Pseudomonas salmasensis]
MANTTVASIPVVTKNDVESIRRYVTKGKSLPTDIDSITGLLKVSTTNIPGLEPSDIKVLYTDISTSAYAWSGVEVSMKKVAAALSTFAEDIKLYGDELVGTIVAMPGYIDFMGKVADISDEDISALPPVYMTNGDGERVSSIHDYLEYLKVSIEDKRLNTQGVIDIIATFRNGLEEIMPNVGAVLKLASKDELNVEITALQAKIDDVELKIDKKKAEYGWGGVWDYITLLSFPAIIGYQVQKRKDQEAALEPLRKNKKELVSQMEARNALIATLHSVSTELNTLFDYVLSAQNTVSQLESIWRGLLEYIESSKQSISTVSQYTVLRTFVIKMRSIIKTWENIKINASVLVVALS